MQKIISLFQRNFEGDRKVRDEVTPGAEWVMAGEGVATRKWDGTCCKVEKGVLYKRYDAKNGKTPPAGFIPAQDPDPVTGHWPGWIKIDGEAKEDRWFREGLKSFCTQKGSFPEEGTYELIGEKINGNPEGIDGHYLIKHGKKQYPDAPTNFGDLKKWFSEKNIEGLVWHNPDGRMVKIKAKDFGIKRY